MYLSLETIDLVLSITVSILVICTTIKSFDTNKRVKQIELKLNNNSGEQSSVDSFKYSKVRGDGSINVMGTGNSVGKGN